MIELDTFKYYNLEDLKRFFGVDRSYISIQINSGKLPCCKIGKSYLFSEKDIIQWIENNRFIADKTAEPGEEVEAKPKKTTKKSTKKKTEEAEPGAEAEVKPKKARKKKSTAEGD